MNLLSPFAVYFFSNLISDSLLIRLFSGDYSQFMHSWQRPQAKVLGHTSCSVVGVIEPPSLTMWDWGGVTSNRRAGECQEAEELARARSEIRGKEIVLARAQTAG